MGFTLIGSQHSGFIFGTCHNPSFSSDSYKNTWAISRLLDKKAADFMISKTDVLIQSRCGQLQTFTDSQKTPKKFTFSHNMYKVFSDFYLFILFYLCMCLAFMWQCGNHNFLLSRPHSYQHCNKWGIKTCNKIDVFM